MGCARTGAVCSCGLSGGADSVALLLLLRELERRRVDGRGRARRITSCAAPEADADEAFCATLAGSLDVPFVAERMDVARWRARAKTFGRRRGAPSRGMRSSSARPRRSRGTSSPWRRKRRMRPRRCCCALLPGPAPRGLAATHARMRPAHRRASGAKVGEMGSCSTWRAPTCARISRRAAAVREDWSTPT